jgi:hypothetical protein
MARLKSAYREKPAEEIPPGLLTLAVPPDVPASEPPVIAAAEIESPQPESNPAAEAEEAAVKADEAALALKGQIEAAKRAEALQRQPALQPQPLPTSREGRLSLWQSAGVNDNELQFLRDHPLMIDHPQLTQAAVQKALQDGSERDSPGYWKAVETNFEEIMDHAKAQAATQPTPEFFRPAPVPVAAKPSAASFVSAPVSREGGDRPARPPTKVTLTAEEREAARFSGISEADYARNKLKMIGAKSRGEIA